MKNILIEEIFTIKFNKGKEYFHIQASNLGAPEICFGGERIFKTTVEDMRKIGEHLVKTAEIIENDKDFKSK
jgi:hypothetical protein